MLFGRALMQYKNKNEINVNELVFRFVALCEFNLRINVANWVLASQLSLRMQSNSIFCFLFLFFFLYIFRPVESRSHQFNKYLFSVSTEYCISFLVWDGTSTMEVIFF